MGRGYGLEQESQVARQLEIAEQERRCAFARTDRGEHLLRRRWYNDELVRPYPRLYARRGYWDTLGYQDRALHVIRGASLLHPNWTFCSLSAAIAYGLEVSGPPSDRLYVATSSSGHRRDSTRMSYRIVEDDRASEANGILVTSLDRTVFDSLRDADFRRGLSVADSALRQTGRTQAELMDSLAQIGRGMRGVGRALETLSWADPRAENGGESMARATMVQLGFERPELQVEFPVVGRRYPYRADFCWTQPDGRLVVGELDGRGKYLDEAMTQSRDVRDVLLDERLRESRISRCGVSGFVRFRFDEIFDPHAFARTLDSFGVPRCGPGGPQRPDPNLRVSCNSGRLLPRDVNWASPDV